MQEIEINITKDFKVKAFVIREFEEDDGSYYHQILYCQNKWIDYTVYPIYKEFNEDYTELLINQKDILIKETDTEWIFGNIEILTPCVIPELDN